MMYLADAEIDETAFNSFFGSSVLEYAKFYTNTYVQAFERPDAVSYTHLTLPTILLV